MNFTAVLLVAIVACGRSSATRCGVTDFLEQLIDSIHTIQQKGGNCARPDSETLPVNMDAIEELINRAVEERLEGVVGIDGLCFMGMKSGYIPDDRITASSFWGIEHEPYRARLDNQRVSGSRGSWSSRRNAVGQWIQVDFGQVEEVAGVITQGRPRETNQWVRSYKVACGTTVRNFETVQQNGSDVVYRGNGDRDTKVYHRFPEVISCRYIRILPQTWYGHISMRMEFVAGRCFNKFNI